MASALPRPRTLVRPSPQTVVLWALFLAAFWLALRLLLVPDPAGGLLLARAQRLESAGMVEQAINEYGMLATTHPDSPYAPQALQREADLLSERARSGKQGGDFLRAIKTYWLIVTHYPHSKLAGTALLSIGSVYSADLHDAPHAAAAYHKLLQDFPNNAEFEGQATLGLGRVALLARDGKAAQSWLQAVLQHFAQFPEQCAEAQFHLGEAYGTLFKNGESARNAFEATVNNYPQSIWAANAKQQLGLLLYTLGAPRARRVLITVPPRIPDQGSDSMDAAIISVLAARGLDINETVLRGWTLEPFVAGVQPADPGRTVVAPFRGWENVAANAGLSLSVVHGGDAKSALLNLQEEVDNAHLGLLYTGAWRMVTGYDSGRNLVFLQSGGRSDKVNTADLATKWNRHSPLGGAYTLVTFSVSGEADRVQQQPITGAPAAIGQDAPPQGPAATPTPVAGAHVTNSVSPLETPTFYYDLKALSEKEGHRRTLRHAAEWLKRSRSGDALLNGEALRFLANEMGRLANGSSAASPSAAAAAASNTASTDTADSEAPVRSDNATATANSASTVGTSGDPLRAKSTADDLRAARGLLAWRGAPLQHWLTARRAAAAYLGVAANRLKDSSLRQAADAFNEEISALENAAAAMPPASSLDSGDGTLSAAARSAFATAAKSIEAARIADGHAADLVAAAAP